MRESESHRRLLRKAWGAARDIADFKHFETGFNQGATGHYASHAEALELLLACCIYARSALEHQSCLDEDVARGFHDRKVRDSTYEDWYRVVGSSSEPPYFRYERGLGENFRNMDLGSISFRLPTAVLLVHMLVHEVVKDSCPFCKAIQRERRDWHRGILYGMPLQRAVCWRCCCGAAERKDEEDEEGLLACLAIVLAHRDLYGHGQELIQRTRVRELVMDIPYCRLSLAQLHLINQALKHLKAVYQSMLPGGPESG